MKLTINFAFIILAGTISGYLFGLVIHCTTADKNKAVQQSSAFYKRDIKDAPS